MTASQPDRPKQVLVLLSVIAVVVSTGVVGVAAAQGTDDASPPVAVYADPTGETTVLYANGTTVSLGVDAEVVGKLANLDGDRRLEAPIVDGSGNLRLVDTSGEVQTLVSGDAATSKTLLPTGDWNGDGQQSVFYENTSNGKLYHVQPGEGPRSVVGPNGDALATNTPIGLADYDSDGDVDLVFAGSSSTVKFYDGESVASTGFSSYGSNNGIGLGSPADFDGDGSPRVPYVTGSGNLALLAADGTKSKVTTSYGGAAKAPVAAANWSGDRRLEFLYVDAESDDVYYTSMSGDVGPVYSSGNRISANSGSGLASTTKPVPPRIEQFDASNPTGRNLSVQFTSSEQLSDIAVELTGPTNSTLTEAAFEVTGSGPYQYTATRTVNADGNYTATLVTAEDTQGIDGAAEQRATVAVQTQAPQITDITLVDVGDSNGVVAGGDEVRITATVSNESSRSSVTANASMFGVGTVDLTRSGGEYTGVFTVQADDVSSDGAAAVAVTATDEYGHTTTSTSNDLAIDTTPPTANAGPDVTVEQDSKLVLNAGKSTDNSRIDRYIWQFGSDVTKHGVAPSHVYTEPGTYTVTLTVVDAVNHTTTDTVTVQVAAAGNETDQTANETDQTTNKESTGTPETAVTRDTEGTVTIRTTNMTAGNPVPVTYRTAAPLNESILVQEIEFVPLRGGNVSMTVHSLNERPARTPNLSAREDLSILDYIQIDHSIDNQNVRDVGLTVVVPKHRLPDGDSQSTVTVFRLEDGQWESYEATKTGETVKAVEYRAQVPGLSTFAVGVSRNQIDVVRANLGDTSLTTDESAIVSAVVKNDGESQLTQRVSLVANGTTVTTKRISLDPGEQRTVTFTYRPERAGDYSIYVDDASAGTLLVTPVRTKSPPLLPIGIGVVTLAFFGGLIAYRRGASVTKAGSTLPDTQRQALVVAYETGYFDIPQESVLEDIASRLDVSEQEASERLRRGLRTLIESTPADERTDPVNAAYEMGYFRIPRATTLEELSTRLRIPKQEAAERLRADLKDVIEMEFMEDG